MTNQKTLNMMTCMHNWRYMKNLYQDRMEYIDTNRRLFTYLREQYIHHRGRLGNMISLKAIQGIFFHQAMSILVTSPMVSTITHSIHSAFNKP